MLTSISSTSQPLRTVRWHKEETPCWACSMTSSRGFNKPIYRLARAGRVSDVAGQNGRICQGSWVARFALRHGSQRCAQRWSVRPRFCTIRFSDRPFRHRQRTKGMPQVQEGVRERVSGERRGRGGFAPFARNRATRLNSVGQRPVEKVAAVRRPGVKARERKAPSRCVLSFRCICSAH